jgi:hypothetical protein
VRFYKEKRVRTVQGNKHNKNHPKRLREPLDSQKTKRRDLYKGGKRRVFVLRHPKSLQSSLV